MNEEGLKDLFKDLRPRIEVKSEYSVSADSGGYFSVFEITLDMEISEDTPIPALDFFPIEDTNLVNVKCYFCKKERTVTIRFYLSSTWSPARFKNDERRVMVCSPYCPTLLPNEQRHLKAYDIVRYESIYVEKGVYTGEYNFKNLPKHELEFRDSFAWNRCYFCHKEEMISYQECFYLGWDNLNFPTGETIRVCSQNCIPSVIV